MRLAWSDAAADWVGARIDGGGRGFGECRAAFVLDESRRIAAGVVFHDWSPERGLIELTCAAQDRRWLTRGVAREVWGYAFSAARLAVGRTSERNTPVRRIWRACGAAEHLIPEMWGDGEAAVILTLAPDAWARSRLGGWHGKAERAEAA